jgi:hypothetical protein
MKLPSATNINQLTHDFEIKITKSGIKYVEFWIYSTIPDSAFVDTLIMTFNNNNYYRINNGNGYMDSDPDRKLLTTKYLIKNDIIEWDDSNHIKFKLTRNFLLQML